MLNTVVADRHSYATYGNGQCQADQKSIALAQMANDIRLLPYLVQLIIRLVPSLQGGAIVLSSCKHHTRNNLPEIATTVYLVTLNNHGRILKVIL